MTCGLSANDKVAIYCILEYGKRQDQKALPLFVDKHVLRRRGACTHGMRGKKKYGKICFSDFPIHGGPERVRTVDLRVANAALSQLSYKPIVILSAASIYFRGTALIPYAIKWWGILGSNQRPLACEASTLTS